MKTELREAAVVTVATALGGVLLGLLWCWLAPRVPLISDGVGGLSQGRRGGTGHRRGRHVLPARGRLRPGHRAWSSSSCDVAAGVPLIVALTVGGILGSLIAWRLGIWLGPTQDVIAHAKEVGKGVTFDAPLVLKAKGALLAWSVSALLVHLGLTALFAPRDPDPYQQHEFPPSAP